MRDIYKYFGFEKQRIECVLLDECAILGSECDVEYNIEHLILNVVGVGEPSTTTTLRETCYIHIYIYMYLFYLYRYLSMFGN